MKFLLLFLTMTILGCNFGLVDIQKEEKVCYDKTYKIGKKEASTDSTKKDCGTTIVTSPFENLIDIKPW